MITSSIKPQRVKTDSGWVISVNYMMYNDAVEINIGQIRDGKIKVCRFEKNGSVTLEDISEGEVVPPTMRLPYEVWCGLSEALVGVLPEVDKKEIGAELRATKYHLEDMRRLSKLK